MRVSLEHQVVDAAMYRLRAAMSGKPPWCDLDLLLTAFCQ
jgi:hypothetical protein